MEYIQDIFEFNINYFNDYFDVTVNQFSGKRCDSNKENLVKITNPTNFQNDFSFNNIDFVLFKKLFSKIRSRILKYNVDFISYVKYHDEIININETLSDKRNYGYIKVSFKDGLNNIDTFDINFSSKDNFYSLENKIILCVNQYCYKRNLMANKSIRNIAFDDIPVVYSPLASGYFIHEIVGHLLEEDIFKSCAYNLENLNISNKLTILDKIDNIGQYIGLNKYDDKGDIILPLVLTKNGKLSNIMAINSESSMNSSLYGFARRETFKNNVQPRMRCTVVQPFDELMQDDIISNYKKAIFLDRVYCGFINPKSMSYTLKGNGYLIENGELTNYIGKITLVGELFHDLNKIEYVGKDLEFNTSDCVKFGQVVRVGMMAPTISISSSFINGECYS